jgi:microcystin-dependent protein
MKPSLEPIPSEAMPTLERPAPPSTTLAMPNLVAIGGAFPAREGGTPACLTMGMVHTYAGAVPVYGAPLADGQMLPVMGNQALYSIFFANFGSNGETEFGIPALRNRAMTGESLFDPPTATTQPMNWLIAAAPAPGATAPLVGSLAAFGGIFVPDGWLPCDGRMLPIGGNVALYEAIGNAFGGENPVFALPNLNEAALYGVGPTGAVGSAVAGPPAGLCFSYLVNVGGLLPASGGNGGFPSNDYWLGQVIAYAGSSVPPGWELADGSLLSIVDHPQLFDLLGHLYGGNGTTNFGLPDLRGKMLVGV